MPASNSLGLQLTFPEGVLPEAWLLKYDDSPVILPRLPESDKMALVIVIAQDMLTDVEDSTAYMVETVAQIDAITELCNPQLTSAALCFVVPRKPLLPFLKEENG
jgi:hypothetical protein